MVRTAQHSFTRRFIAVYNGAVKRAFTVIELIVVIGIVSILSTVILANYNTAGGQILLRNLSYDVALSIREAQIYGISLRQLGGGGFGTGYGVHFAAATPQNYTLFGDKTSIGIPGNNVYDGINEEVRTFSLGTGYSITDICITTQTGADRCASRGEVSSVDIAFQRPEPDALIRTDGSLVLHQQARITLHSIRGFSLNVVVDITGQISVRTI
jgi:prepilin-type N-terminal cleavage/methylation domain-containing protein